MRIENIRLADFRNYASLDFAPAAGLNVLVGANAQGKSNLLEALAMLGTGKSFRAHRERELIREGSERAEVGGEARVAAGEIRLRCTIARTPAGTRKTFEVNGGAVGFARFLGRARVVTFVPADLQLVAGGPSLRRAFLNEALAQLSPTYYRDLARYQKIVQQKAALLRGAIAPDRDLLLAYNDELVRPATAIVAARRAFVDELAAATVGIYARWRGARERLGVTYAPNPEGDVAEALAGALESELRRRTTLVGPHRDDLRLLVDGVPLAAFGSQGQQRTAVLALKVAEYDVMRARTGDAPILLLDDVLSELDAERAGGFLGAVEGFEQAFLTATDAPRDDRAAARWSVRAATVSAC
ncbi:MAG TPA: DNA replication/repair protein RecF [Candidatus Elarobacter sp.]|jgi:DNA replication and repair protein RecF|nr:DNA replication/repair protein RecF [Candidatus Elarobacter sp.]